MVGDPISVSDTRLARLTHAERVFVRLSIVQSILAVAGVFTGAVALYAALTESAAVRRQVAAEVWPYVQTTIQTDADESGPSFAVRFANVGVGPAQIRSMRLVLDGRPARSWDEALAIAGLPDVTFTRLSVSDRVIGAGDAFDLFRVTGQAPVDAFARLSSSPRTRLEYCYCSIHGQCWQAIISPQVEPAGEVEECPDFGAEAFTD